MIKSMDTKNILFIGTILVLVIFIVGCTQKETKFVCPSGTVVSDESMCPKVEKTQTTPTTNYVQENVVIYQASGVIQQSIISSVLKEVRTPEGGVYGSNIYQGGGIEVTLSASSALSYTILGGEKCVTEGEGTMILKKGSVREGTDTWKPEGVSPNQLCIKIENPGFKDWNNINPVTYNILIKVLQRVKK